MCHGDDGKTSTILEVKAGCGPVFAILPAAGILIDMHQINGVRDPATSFPLDIVTDDAGERRQANRAVAISALGLALTGLVELSIALVSGSVALLGDALHNLSDVSTSALVFVGFRASRRLPTERYPYGYERAEDLAGIGVALVIWGSALVAGFESVNKLLRHGSTIHVGWGMAAAAVGIAGNQLVARYKLTVGRRIRSATMVADAKHSWLDALSSAGAMLGLTGVALGWTWGDAIAGIVVTGFICHVGWEVTADIGHRLLDGVDPQIITTAETAAIEVPGVQHAHARARWTGRTLRVEVEGFLASDTSLTTADQIGRSVASLLTSRIPEMQSFTWSARAA
jgi:cation diffusion facilitator family transporter